MVVPADAPERAELERQGWAVVARSFGAQLDANRLDQQRLSRLVSSVAAAGSIREHSATSATRNGSRSSTPSG